MKQRFLVYIVTIYQRVGIIRVIYKLLRRIFSRYKLKRLIARRVARGDQIKVILGANKKYQDGWIPTEIYNLNLLNPKDWERYFVENTIDALVAEHVWEHLTEEEGVLAAQLCYRYLKPGSLLRVAVPDGFFPDQEYIRWVEPSGIGPSAHDHKILYNYKILQEVFERAGFETKLLEYFDEDEQFHYEEWDPDDGRIIRSMKINKGRQFKNLRYRSLILDAVK